MKPVHTSSDEVKMNETVYADVRPRFTLEEAIEKVYHWQYSDILEGTSYFSRLCTLHQKADADNKTRLRIIYPNFCLALSLWERSEDNGDKLFKDIGLLK